MKTRYLNVSERKLILQIFDYLSLILGLYFTTDVLEIKYFSIHNPKFPIWIFLFLCYFTLFSHVFEMYNIRVSSSRYMVVRSTTVTILVSLFFFILTPYITPSLPLVRIEILYTLFFFWFPVLVFRFLYIRFIFSPKYFKKILVIGESNIVDEFLDVINKKAFQNDVIAYVSDKKIESQKKYKFIDIKEVNLTEIIGQSAVDEIIISSNKVDDNDYNWVNKQLIKLFKLGINVKSIPNAYEEILGCISKENLNKSFYENLSFSNNHENSFYLFIMRTVDIVAGIIGMLSLLFIVPLVFLGNLIGNQGDLFYKQQRVGRRGELFYILKFRSMVTNAEKNGAVWAQKNDSRITKFGKILRKSRLDEIPQFWNILIGEMSLIGPRPERPEFVEELKKELTFYEIRHVIRPGLTGWAQVLFPYASTKEEQEIKLRYDLYYIKSRSLYLDFKIFIKTISSVVLMKGQ